MFFFLSLLFSSLFHLLFFIISLHWSLYLFISIFFISLCLGLRLCCMCWFLFRRSTSQHNKFGSNLAQTRLSEQRNTQIEPMIPVKKALLNDYSITKLCFDLFFVVVVVLCCSFVRSFVWFAVTRKRNFFFCCVGLWVERMRQIPIY